MQPHESSGKPHRNAQELPHLHWADNKSIKGLAAGALEYERRLSTVVLRQGQWTNRPLREQFIPERIFVLQFVEGSQPWSCGSGLQHQDVWLVRARPSPPPAVQDELVVLADWLENIT